MNVNLKLVRAIITELGIRGLPHPRRRIPNLIRLHTPADLVNHRFTATRPNELWCTEITEHPARDGKVYCCAILDCFSKLIVARAGNTSRTAFQNPSAPSPTASTGAVMPRRLQSRSRSAHDWWIRGSRR
jgi:transposase InsO family protein